MRSKLASGTLSRDDRDLMKRKHGEHDPEIEQCFVLRRASHVFGGVPTNHSNI